RVGAEDRPDALELFVDDRIVELDDGGKAERVREAVMEPLFARERMRERVAGAEPFLERDGAHHGGFHHSAAGFQVVSVLDGADEVLRAKLETAKRDR